MNELVLLCIAFAKSSLSPIYSLPPPLFPIPSPLHSTPPLPFPYFTSPTPPPSPSLVLPRALLSLASGVNVWGIMDKTL